MLPGIAIAARAPDGDAFRPAERVDDQVQTTCALARNQTMQHASNQECENIVRRLPGSRAVWSHRTAWLERDAGRGQQVITNTSNPAPVPVVFFWNMGLTNARHAPRSVTLSIRAVLAAAPDLPDLTPPQSTFCCKSWRPTRRLHLCSPRRVRKSQCCVRSVQQTFPSQSPKRSRTMTVEKLRVREPVNHGQQTTAHPTKAVGDGA